MKKLSVVILLGLIVFSSCRAIREKKAANHQPFKPHHDKPMKQKRHH